MKFSEAWQQRQSDWRELESLCRRLEGGDRPPLASSEVHRFGDLYRSACADLALADAYQLPPSHVEYLHQLVGRAHNQLYRSRHLQARRWATVLLREAPRTIFRDGCLRWTVGCFAGTFALSAALAAAPREWPDFVETLLSAETITYLEEAFARPSRDRSNEENQWMAAYYIRHNTGIGLQCFAGGLLFVPGLLITVYNAALLGATFGYMARPDVAGGDHFFQFVTAHAPCELTAIVLSAGAGLKLGMGWVRTQGMTRIASLRRAAVDSMPILGAALFLFGCAAIIEGFLSPSAAPYVVKAAVAAVTSGLLVGYFLVLGWHSDPRVERGTHGPGPAGQAHHATRPHANRDS